RQLLPLFWESCIFIITLPFVFLLENLRIPAVKKEFEELLRIVNPWYPKQNENIRSLAKRFSLHPIRWLVDALRFLKESIETLIIEDYDVLLFSGTGIFISIFYPGGLITEHI